MKEWVFIVLVWVLLILHYACASTLEDTSPLTLTPTQQHYYVTSNIPLSFTANKPIQSTGVTFYGYRCTFGAPSVFGQTVTATLLDCDDASFPFLLEVTVLDMTGNSVTKLFSYSHLTEYASPAANKVTANTALFPLVMLLGVTQFTDISFVAVGCTLDTPQVGAVYLYVYVTLLNCTDEGPFSLVVTVLDEYGNPFTTTTNYEYVSVLPALTPSLDAGSTVIENTVLSFTMDQPIQFVSATFVAAGCSFYQSQPDVYGQTASATLLSCVAQGTFTLTVTFRASESTILGTLVIDYDYTGTTLIPLITPNSRVKPNTRFSVTVNVPIQSTSLGFGTYCFFNQSIEGQIISATLSSKCGDYDIGQGLLGVSVTVTDVGGNSIKISNVYIFDTVGPTFTSSITANALMKSNTPLSFTTNEPVQSVNIEATGGCTMDTPTWSDQVITTTLLSCPVDGPFLLNITASDMLGNTATRVIKYMYSSVVLTFTPSLLANTTVKPITVLSFTANVAIQPSNISFVAPGCTLGNPNVNGQVVMAFLVGCFADGHFTLIVTASDMVGNTGSHLIDYMYDSMATTITPPPTPPPDTPPTTPPTTPPDTPPVASALKPSITDNTPLSFTTTDAIQPTGVQVVAPGCTFGPSTVQIQTIFTTLLSCSTEGPISLTVSVLDQNGNTDSHVMDYIYHSTTQTEGVNATLQNVSLPGNVQFTSNSSSTVTTSTQIIIEGCATFGGHLAIQVPNLQQAVESTQTFINYSCYGGGQFESITLQDPETNTSCSTQGSYLAESFNALVKSCESDGVTASPPDYTGAIIGGVIGGVALLALIAVLIICFVKPIHDRVFPHRNRMVDMNEELQPTQKRHRGKTLGPDANRSSLYDNQGKSGDNALYI